MLFVLLISIIIFFAVPTGLLYEYSRGFYVPYLPINREVFIGIMTFGQYSLVISAVLFILLKYYSIEKRSLESTTGNVSERQAIIDTIFREILSKDKFFTLFNTTLPVGKKDEELGIDYIPFMLNAIQANKAEFENKANAFLRWAIYTGSLFIVIIFVFAYLIINNSALSFASSLEKLRQENQQIQSLLVDVPKEKTSEQLTKNNVLLDSLKTSISSKLDTNSTNTKSLLKSISKYERDDNLIEFNNIIQNNSTSLFEIGLSKEVDGIQSLLKNQEVIKQQLFNYTSNVNDLIKKAEIEVEKPQNQTNELIKRVSIGLIVTSFLFAILRFLILQYQNNILNKIKSENDDLLIRKLYIGLKISNPATDERKIFIQKLLALENIENKSENAISADEASILKDVINAILKKV